MRHSAAARSTWGTCAAAVALALLAPMQPARAQDAATQPTAEAFARIGAPDISISQVGVENRIEVTSPSSEQSLLLSQRGYGNEARATIAAGATVVLESIQLGDENEAAFTLANPGISFGQVRAAQTGAGNSLELEQRVASVAFASIEQNGRDNSVELSQEGDELSASVLQNGSGNSLELSQLGVGLSADISQLGNLQGLVIEQLGVGGGIVVTQTGR